MLSISPAFNVTLLRDYSYKFNGHHLFPMFKKQMHGVKQNMFLVTVNMGCMFYPF